MEAGRLEKIERLLAGETQETLPKAVEQEVQRLIEPGERRLVTLSTDIAPDGRYDERWLLVTERRLATFAAENGRARVELDLPLSELRGVRLRDFIGNGSLEVITDTEAVEVVRFSRTIAPQMSQVQRVLRALADVSESGGDRPRGRGGPGKVMRCESCGRALPRWSEV